VLKMYLANLDRVSMESSSITFRSAIENKELGIRVLNELWSVPYSWILAKIERSGSMKNTYGTIPRFPSVVCIKRKDTVSVSVLYLKKYDNYSQIHTISSATGQDPLLLNCLVALSMKTDW